MWERLREATGIKPITDEELNRRIYALTRQLEAINSRINSKIAKRRAAGFEATVHEENWVRPQEKRFALLKGRLIILLSIKDERTKREYTRNAMKQKESQAV